jgi:ribosomal protein S4
MYLVRKKSSPNRVAAISKKALTSSLRNKGLCKTEVRLVLTDVAEIRLDLIRVEHVGILASG